MYLEASSEIFLRESVGCLTIKVCLKGQNSLDFLEYGLYVALIFSIREDNQ